jgi:hypothetical protein
MNAETTSSVALSARHLEHPIASIFKSARQELQFQRILKGMNSND